MWGTAGCRRAASRYPVVVDGLLAGSLFGLVVLGALRRGGPEHQPLSARGVLLMAVVFAALMLRRRWPLPVLVYVTGGALVLMAVEGPRHPYALAVGVAAYTVGARLDRATALWAGAGSALSLGVGAVLTSADSWTEAATLLVVVWTGMTTAVGLAVGNHRAYVAAVEERARRAEQSREEEAHRRVIEERMRIARELHDVVAHHIALINVQAGVAAHLVRAEPDAATEALGHVRAASRAVLSELSTLLGVLRAVDDQDAPVEPAPGLGRLDTLLESFRTTGLRLTASCHGDRRALPAGLDLAAYRIVQEALTNVHKHGGGAPGSLELSYHPDGLEIQVHNAPAAGSAARRNGSRPGGSRPRGAGPGGSGHGGSGHGGAGHGGAGHRGRGHGLLGMRERVAAVGGVFTAGPQPDGGFAVYARLPLPEGPHGDDPRPAG